MLTGLQSTISLARAGLQNAMTEIAVVVWLHLCCLSPLLLVIELKASQQW